MVAPRTGTRYFTVAEANGTLPLVRVIVRDITELAKQLRERHERLNRLRPGDRFSLSAAHDEEVQQGQAELERGQEKMEDYVRELKQLGVELKDYFTGLIDFPSVMNGRRGLLVLAFGRTRGRPLARTGSRLRGTAKTSARHQPRLTSKF